MEKLPVKYVLQDGGDFYVLNDLDECEVIYHYGLVHDSDLETAIAARVWFTDLVRSSIEPDFNVKI